MKKAMLFLAILFLARFSHAASLTYIPSTSTFYNYTENIASGTIRNFNASTATISNLTVTNSTFTSLRISTLTVTSSATLTNVSASTVSVSTLDVTSNLYFPDGTSAAPGLAFRSQKNMGIVKNGLGSWSFVNNGVGQFSVNNTGDMSVAGGLSGNTVTSSNLLRGNGGLTVYETNAAVLDVTSSSITLALPTSVKGTTTNDEAPAGYVGEWSTGTYGGANNGAFQNAAPTNVFVAFSTITIPSGGDWMVCGLVQTSLNGATMTRNTIALSVFSGNTTTDQLSAKTENDIGIPLSTNNLGGQLCYRFEFSGASTVYVKTRAAFTGGPPQYLAFGWATRRR